MAHYVSSKPEIYTNSRDVTWLRIEPSSTPSDHSGVAITARTQGSFIGAVRPENALNARVISLGHEWWAPAFASPLSEASIGNDGPNHG